MTESAIEELKLAERKFLHDIANDIVVAQGMCSFVIRNIKANKPMDEKDLDRLEKTQEAIGKMTQKLKERRSVLMGTSDIII